MGLWSEDDDTAVSIEERLNFLSQEDDEKYIEEYKFSENDFDIDKEIQNNSNEKMVENCRLYKEFADKCRKIYENYAEIDKQTQVAVSMLFKEVTKKFLDHYHYLVNSSTETTASSDDRVSLPLSERAGFSLGLSSSTSAGSPPIIGMRTEISSQLMSFIKSVDVNGGILYTKDIKEGSLTIYRIEKLGTFKYLDFKDKKAIEELLKNYSKEQIMELIESTSVEQ